MRIALVTEASSGGVGRHVDLLARGLRDLGEAVEVFFSPHRSAPWFQRNLAQAGVPTAEVDIYRRVGLHDLRSLVDLRRRLSAGEPFDVIHGHSSKAGALVRALPASMGLRVYSPHAFVTLDDSLPRPVRLGYELAERCLARRTDLLLATSKDERRESLRLGYDPKRVLLVANGIDPPDFMDRQAARAELLIPAGAVCLGFIGRFTAQKRPLRLLESVRALPADLPIHVAMIGSGELAQEVTGAIAAYGLGSRVTVHGSDVAWRYMSAFDLLLMTSAYEGMPYVLIEALHAGLPIITDPIGGVEELVRHGCNGFVAPKGAAVDTLARHVLALATDSELRTAMGAQSLAMSAVFNKVRSTADTLQAYRTMAASRA